MPDHQSSTKKTNCPSGIISAYGQCWICNKSLHTKYKQEVKTAKNVIRGLSACSSEMNKTQLSERQKAWNNLWRARSNENSCWRPSHQNHINEERLAKEQSNKCENLLKGI